MKNLKQIIEEEQRKGYDFSDLLNDPDSIRFASPRDNNVYLRPIQKEDMQGQESFFEKNFANIPEVVGQKRAVRELSMCFYRTKPVSFGFRSAANDLLQVQKQNILIYGPSGCGKTFLTSEICKKHDRLYAISDTTEMTSHGYVGKDIEEPLLVLLKKAEGNVKKAEQGVVIYDEIDKLVMMKMSDSEGGYGTQLQSSLLKMMEGKTIQLRIPREENGHVVGYKEQPFNTSNLLFVFCGAFTTLPDVMRKRRKLPPDAPVDIRDAEKDDFVSFGFIQEFMGRIPNIVAVDPLTEPDLAEIFVRGPHSRARQAQALFIRLGHFLDFTEDAVIEIAKQAKQKDVGARGLDNVVSELTNNIIYQLPDPKAVHLYVLLDGDSIRRGSIKVSAFESDKAYNACVNEHLHNV